MPAYVTGGNHGSSHHRPRPPDPCLRGPPGVVPGEPVGPDLQVVKVGNLAKQPAKFVARFLHVDTADLMQRFTRQSWLALRADGSVAQVAQTKVGVQALILADYE